MLLETPVCDFGWQAPDFELKTPDGVAWTRDRVMGGNGMLIAFICNHCPYVIAVIDRLVADINAIKEAGVGVACVMSNDYAAYPADAPDKMLAFADTHGLTVPYLVDEDQSVARAYGAVCTPDLFGFDRAGGLQYRGRIDSAMMKDAANRVPELRNAMMSVAKGAGGPRVQTPSMGCSIKWR
ncbi:AhpC/TSA family protein [Cognatiyoonia koreensis]|uniref:AhpC/TSA family protein n=1 Tax=Cognatiyoonia koreensis TaxID=364200 RepID=A0A1I0RVU6_9RHOB|nr:thioredoxin family protein [Cognatiyoonia koreensis]SEW45615.1 AhpC/TSA family protein [Cognatiyoonia koreensis]